MEDINTKKEQFIEVTNNDVTYAFKISDITYIDLRADPFINNIFYVYIHLKNNNFCSMEFEDSFTANMVYKKILYSLGEVDIELSNFLKDYDVNFVARN